MGRLVGRLSPGTVSPLEPYTHTDKHTRKQRVVLVFVQESYYHSIKIHVKLQPLSEPRKSGNKSYITSILGGLLPQSLVKGFIKGAPVSFAPSLQFPFSDKLILLGRS